jgi:hypothetical protein
MLRILKNVWLLGGILTIGAVVAVTAEQHRAAEKYQRESQEDCARLAITAEENHPCENKTQGDKDYAPWWYILFTWPAGITTWALLGTGFAITWQSSETRKAARAAFLNAQAVINAERAVLLFTVRKIPVQKLPGCAIFEIYVKNFGKTPAREVCIGTFKETMVADCNRLPLPPVYGTQNTEVGYIIPQEERLVASFYPAKPSRIAEKVSVSTEHGITLNDVQDIVFGEITYSDGISLDMRYSRCCYRFERKPYSNIGGSIVSCGPAEYRKCI